MGVVDGRVWRVRQEGRRLDIAGDGVSDGLPALLRHLAVDAPLRRIERALAEDPVLRRILPATSGVAVMRQDPWECLISYIVSAFNNIPKIRLTLNLLSRRFGTPLGEGRYAFPTPEQLAGARPGTLRACILGYRAPYVRAVARVVAAGQIDLEAVRRSSYEQAREALLLLPGVGEKVVECILLFALGHGQAFPVDVWIHRTVQREYLRDRRVTPREVRRWAQEHFGPLAGYANQHLFFAARTGILR